jgi:hypothetical protein
MRGDLPLKDCYFKENNYHETQISARRTRGLLPKPVHSTAKGPIGPLRRFRRPVMTKTTTKATAAAKESTASAPLIVLGYDENHKPRAARFPAKDADLVTKAARLMDLKVYEAVSEDLAALAKKLPEGRLYGNGRAFVPNVRQSLYSQVIVALAVEPQAAVGKDQDELPVATGLPRTWDEIAPGHLVIAQEGLDHGWWEAIVLGRAGDMFTLRFRDYPKLPKFVRHRNAIALMSPPAE